MISLENGIRTLTKYHQEEGKNKLPIKILNFEFCTQIGDEAIKLLLECYKDTLEKFTIVRSFYENCEMITGSCFDLEAGIEGAKQAELDKL